MPIGLCSITELPEIMTGLSTEGRAIFDRIYHLSTTTGELVLPEAMTGWVTKFFGSTEAVTRQRITKITNMVTMEGALFNELRANRPIETTVGDELQNVIAENKGDPFCHPEDGTPADVFGRIKGAFSISASNVAKYDGFHGLVVFNEHNPLEFTRDYVRDYFTTARQWAEAALNVDPEAKYYFLIWNCLWKSGASIVHGHAQMTATRDMHYAKVEHLRRMALEYRIKHGYNYFADLHILHEQLDLAWSRDGVRGMAYLTPVKEKEILLLADRENYALYDEIYRVLARYRELGVKSFNVALFGPPLAEAREDWSGFPVIVRIVDRGDPNNKTADFGAMELYAQSVIASDPFKVAAFVRG